MADIVLATLNAKYIHTAVGLRYLLANLGPLRASACLLEFDLTRRPVDVVESLLAHQPRLIGLGVYIWNAGLVTEVVVLLKRLRPDVTVVLGGPEVSHEPGSQPAARLADYVISGEADFAFAALCQAVLQGRPAETSLEPSLGRWVHLDAAAGQPLPECAAGPASGSRPTVLLATPPDLARMALPYELYSADDLAHRVVYVEASRGCPFRCQFCLSSLDVPVRQFPLPDVLQALGRLLDRGARQFKFVDRSFNLDVPRACAILEFLLERHRQGCSYHFEMVPDRLPGALREVIRRFPPGVLQLEIGVQTFNPEVAARIERRQDLAQLEQNFRWLRAETGAHLHADLIAGLPGESLESLAAGFDRLVALGPQEIQFGILKRLRGVGIGQHDAAWEMVYNPQPPYEILQNKLIDFATMQRLRRFARHWDLVANSGHFLETTPLIWSGNRSPFQAFWHWSDWLHRRAGRTDAIALARLAAWLFEFLTTELGLPARTVAETLARDYRRGGRRDLPEVIQAARAGTDRTATAVRQPGLPRQARHLAAECADLPKRARQE